MNISFTVPGPPQGKARPRFIRATGHTYTPESTVLYENLIKTEYALQCHGARFPDDAYLCMTVDAYYEVPASASGKRKAEMWEGRVRPTKKPDADNVLKCVADALNKLAYRDDSQIVHAVVRKQYDNRARIEVQIWEAGEAADE